VRIFRFDDEVSIPVTRFGSRFRIGPLAGKVSGAQVQVMHVPPGGSIGRHPAAAPQLLAVLAGRGTVTGGDGASRELGPGYAVLWDAGEEHGTSSDEGLTAVCLEGRFEVWAMGVTADIVVADYDAAWPGWFEAIRAHVWPAVEDVALRIDHVGSTSVPGLAAKPVIDLDVVVATEAAVPPAIDRLAGLGYRWRGDLGVPGREAFKAPAPGDLPAHHLYLVVEDSKAHLDHWLLRDLLLSDPEARERYAALKRRNVDLADGDMDVYVAAKAELVAELLTRARAERGLPPAAYWRPGASGGGPS
jgi:GrpB-like predicted nucleotidyltransferase (UPF0157 family)/mannose-6-phosphate isomerase-like protein (cupin superfamily)